MKKITSKLIFIYQITLSSLLVILFGKGCRFLPTCSDYCRQAINKHGVLIGTCLTLKRLFKCHPFYQSGFDPVPDSL